LCGSGAGFVVVRFGAGFFGIGVGGSLVLACGATGTGYPDTVVVAAPG
jgi:hypothetical protein